MIIVLKIEEFPEAECIKAQKDEYLCASKKVVVKIPACYKHPSFKRFAAELQKEIDWVSVIDGTIVGPSARALPAYQQLKETVLSL